MKYRIFGVVMTVIMVLAMAAFSFYSPEETSHRVHQHRTARGPDAGCDCDGSELCTHLPLVIIDTGGQEIPGKPTAERDQFGQSIYTSTEDGSGVIEVSVSVIENQGRNNHPSDAPALTTRSQFRIRGNSSRQFDKKPYLLNFVDEDGNNRDLSVMGMDAHHEWVLNGPYLDKSLVRNYMWYNIAGEIMDYAPNVRFCEVILDGEYQGLYLMVESVTSGDGCRLDLSVNVQDRKVTGYLLRIDRPTQAELTDVRNIDTFLERSGQLRQDISVRYPGRNNLTPEMARRIEVEFSEFERALYSYDYDSQEYGYQAWIDVDSFVDYYLINELSANVDAGNYSTYIYKNLGGKYKMCVWDFNNACDNYQESETSPYGFLLYDRPLYFMLFKDEAFVARVIQRYQELRKTYLSEEYLMNYIDETIAYLGGAVERNFAVWGYTFQDETLLVPARRNLSSFDEAVEQLKSFLRQRGHWIDRNIDTLQQYSHPSRNKGYDY